tara:strand:+ start:353 stop:496 length:144 start_codon:yes stop_codon:yes gene_type:complete
MVWYVVVVHVYLLKNTSWIMSQAFGINKMLPTINAKLDAIIHRFNVN